jgi:hypothetical protein
MNNLLECVVALKDVRRSMQSDADSCILAALDEAIAKLERRMAEGDQTELNVAQAALGALAVLSDILTCAGAIAELVKRFGT